jgi:very-short-patch-repair endonuclease
MLINYGVDNPLKSKQILNKVRHTNLLKYGCENPNQVLEFKNKAKITSIERYGVDNAAKNEDVKRKTYMTNLQKYGVMYTIQSPEVRAKANETLCNNGVQKTSKQQLYLHSVFGGEINYPIKYYAADICFPEEKLIIEYDGGGHSLRVALGNLTQEEFNKKEIIRNNIIKREGYKQMRIISSKDLLPSDQILLQILQNARSYFSQYPNHSWIEFNIDTSSVRNAENPQGVSYYFGSLRTIKESDLQITKSDS